jgi:hypothetical protein
VNQVVQIVGALLILAAFTAVQLDRMRPDSRLYLTLNLLGSIILAVLAVAAEQWAIVSAWVLFAALHEGRVQ